MITRAVSRAMSAQLDRVRQADSVTDTRLREAYDLIEEQRTQIARLQEQLAECRGDSPAQAQLTLNNRPVITQAQAAAQIGRSVATVSRYCASDFWQAAQPPGTNRWLIYADQPLTCKQAPVKRA